MEITNPVLKTYLFNVESGDNLLIALPNGEFGLIDFYFSAPLNQNKPPSLAYLEYLHNKEKKKIIVSFCCISHYDFDHIHGIKYLIDLWETGKIEIKNLWLSGTDIPNRLLEILDKINDANALQPSISPDFDLSEILQSLKDDIKLPLQNLSYLMKAWRISTGKKIKFLKNASDIDNTIYESMRTFSIAPLDHHIYDFENLTLEQYFLKIIPKGYNPARPNNNLISSIFFLQYGELSLSFGGDAPLEVWHDSLDNIKENDLPYKVASDFIKVSHHGSATSTSPRIWASLTENKNNINFGISAGKKYNHPSPLTIKEINAACKKIDYAIWSTNICSSCAVGLSETLMLFDNRKDMVAKLFKEDNAPAFKSLEGKQTGEGFLGYCFHYDLSNFKGEVYKLQDKNIRSNEECIFRQGQSVPHTECKITQLK